LKTSNKGIRFPVETLTEAEVIGLLKACSKGPSGIRNQGLLAILYRAGLRVSEACDLLPKDLDPQRCSLRVLHGKGDRARVVGLDPGAWSILLRWLDRRTALGIGASRPVFCTLTGGSLSTAYLRALMKRLGRKAKIAKRCHPHGLRHCCASELRQEGVEIGLIAKQLGHRSIVTTVRYLDHICPEQVLNTMRARTWGDLPELCPDSRTA
jgi:site-specific recombinase XerD